ncbi:MAG: carboxypeptidase regulatory-like domain-containing protein [Halioglobus sp.]|nr:carboxypeptidase regulatory-like domain-containing protein [Halioglobus sp.]
MLTNVNVNGLRATGYLALCLVLSACSDSGSDSDSGSATPQSPVSARVATDADLLSGPLARGVAGDYVLENEHLRIIIQQPGRQWLSIGTFGGNIIDVSVKDSTGALQPDHLEEFVMGLNIENTANYTNIRIVNDGSDGGAAKICATGPDDLLELANASSATQMLGVALPASADDIDLPVDMETCYTLEAGAHYVVLDTAIVNQSSEDIATYLTEYMNGSGQVEFFQPHAGFGEPQFTSSCPEDTYVACDALESGLCDQCNFVVYSGIDGAAGVSYGLIHGEQNSSSFSTAGINIVVYGDSVLNLLLGLTPANYTIPANGTVSLRRYFAVGADGTVANIAKIRDEIFGFSTTEVSGTVNSQGQPLEGAQVVVYQVLDELSEPPSLFIVNHSSTDVTGKYSLTLPPGNYQIRANMEGYLYPVSGPVNVTINDTAITRDFEMPESGYLEVTVIDETGPGPAKVQLVGFDPTPPLTNIVAGNIAGVFGDVNADALPFGVAQATFIDRNGASERITVEPGEYRLVVSRGPFYSAFERDITIVSGELTTVQAEIVKLVDTSGFISADFHVHSIDSPDSEVTREERVAVMLAEGIEFFTPSDHGVRSDFGPTLANMDVEDLIAVAPSSETTTFDYGHVNSWPVTIDRAQIGGGAFDWAGAAMPGEDFPSYGNYNLPPAAIYEGLKRDPKDNLVQINHIGSFFGASGAGIDTGMTPPQSSVDPASKRLDPSIDNLFDDNFDALELWIGTNGRGAIESEFLGRNAGIWFNLMNQDLIPIGIANSDTHDRRFTRTSARTLVASDTNDPADLSVGSGQLAATLLAGKAFGTNAPFLLLRADGVYDGQSQSAGLRSDESVSMPVDAGSDLVVTATVSTSQWAEVDTIHFYINNQPERTNSPGDTASYGICANATVTSDDAAWGEVDVVVNAAVPGASRTDISVTLSLQGISEDSWIVAMARGTDGKSKPLFPVLPSSLNQSSNTTLADLTDGNLNEGGVQAFAFTNPLFVDVDGDGWRAPGVANAPCSLEL